MLLGELVVIFAEVVGVRDEGLDVSAILLDSWMVVGLCIILLSSLLLLLLLSPVLTIYRLEQHGRIVEVLQ